MTNVMYVPLDERPVNYLYPQTIARDSGEINLVVPPIDILGRKKTPADREKLWGWIEDNIGNCTYLSASIDMLMYGGIVPSRLHHMDIAACDKIIERIIRLKKKQPSLQILAFNLIMRLPAYSSDDEEPDYYGTYGRNIFEYAWALDRIERGRADESEKASLHSLKRKIPAEYLEDYIGRRSVNSYVNRRMIDLANEGVLDFLVIPLDDCSEYGFSAAEQMDLLKLIEKYNIQDKVYIYPGADDLGCSMTGRIINLVRKTTPLIYVRYSSTAGPGIIPKYEDRPLGESIKSQILAAGGLVADNAAEADFILMVNSPTVGAADMCEAPMQKVAKDRTYYSFRNLREFAAAMEHYMNTGRKCALADVAFSNGSDDELMRMLNKKGLLPRLISYAGWNTSGNTLGTVIAYAIVNYRKQKSSMDKQESSVGKFKSSVGKFFMDRLVEDWGYQAIVRQELAAMGNELGITYRDLRDRAEQTEQVALEKLRSFIDENLSGFKGTYSLDSVYFPWNRLFEIGLCSSI